MKKIEKAMQIETNGLREKIMNKHCPHYYGMKDDRATSRDFTCDGNCKRCWNEEVEWDSNE